jgi:hypothetical protein
MSFVRALLLHVLLSAAMLASPSVALAQETPPAEGGSVAPTDPFAQIVLEMNRLNGANTLCMYLSWPMPRVATWAMHSTGSLTVTRTDVPDHIGPKR